MTKDAETRKPNGPLYTKAFRPLLHFQDWVARWTAAETVEEAIGLLNVLPDHFSEDRKPDGVRFLLEFLDIQADPTCLCIGTCRHVLVRDKARELLALHFLKEPKERSLQARYPWYQPIRDDPTLFPLTLRVLSQPHFTLDREKIVQQFVGRCLEAHYGERVWGDDFSELVTLHLEALLPLVRNPDLVREHDRSPKMAAALRTLALRPNIHGKAPRDLEEAVLTPGNEWFARKLLVLEAYSRAKSRQEAEAKPTAA